MTAFLLYHRHAAADCAAAFAAWNGFTSSLRGATAPSTCAFGGHEIWWSVDAEDERHARRTLPEFLANRTVIIRVATVVVP